MQHEVRHRHTVNVPSTLHFQSSVSALLLLCRYTHKRSKPSGQKSHPQQQRNTLLLASLWLAPSLPTLEAVLTYGYGGQGGCESERGRWWRGRDGVGGPAVRPGTNAALLALMTYSGTLAYEGNKETLTQAGTWVTLALRRQWEKAKEDPPRAVFQNVDSCSQCFSLDCARLPKCVYTYRACSHKAWVMTTCGS